MLKLILILFHRVSNLILSALYYICLVVSLVYMITDRSDIAMKYALGTYLAHILSKVYDTIVNASIEESEEFIDHLIDENDIEDYKKKKDKKNK